MLAALGAAAAASLCARAAGAPVLEALEPPGVRAGETATLRVVGRGLARVEGFSVSAVGVEAVALRPAAAGEISVRVRAGPGAPLGFHELRAIGPEGISNLLVLRVDALPQVREAEPNDDLATANPVAPGSAVAGVIGPQDIDCYAFQGRAGARVTLEVEARRLGSPVVPVARLLGPSGASLALSQPLRDGGGDCRLSFVLPGDGRYAVEVRDALYCGGARAQYRLRLDTGPFATGLFPLGGRCGETIPVAACGGSLAAPWFKSVTLPGQPGAMIDPGWFNGPGGSLLAPGRLVAGEGPEIDEPSISGSTGPAYVPTRVAFGATVNGRIDRSGEVDRYGVSVPPGEALQVDVQAGALGSWLDSVVIVSDTQGQAVATADDQRAAGKDSGGLLAASRDSRLEVSPRAAGDLVVAITDRFGDGGPEYGYRLRIGPPRGDFAVTLETGGHPSQPAPEGGSSGAFNLRPGMAVPLSLRIAGNGRPGPITLRAEGLPPGVEAAAVTVRIAQPAPPAAAREAGPTEATLVLRVDANAAPATGAFHIVASARRPDGSVLTHRASAILVLASLPPDDLRAAPVRVVTEFPVAVLVVGER
jgi:hypothetical protein